ncbi:hypothetical protein GEMRC1_008420 [Eukaryota sp. GEM-RC1]
MIVFEGESESPNTDELFSTKTLAAMREQKLRIIQFLVDDCNLLFVLPTAMRECLEATPRQANISNLISLGKIIVDQIDISNLIEQNPEWRWFNDDVINPTLEKSHAKSAYAVDDMESLPGSDDEFTVPLDVDLDMDRGSDLFNQIVGNKIRNGDESCFDWNVDEAVFEIQFDDDPFDFVKKDDLEDDEVQYGFDDEEFSVVTSNHQCQEDQEEPMVEASGDVEETGNELEVDVQKGSSSGRRGI